MDNWPEAFTSSHREQLHDLPEFGCSRNLQELQVELLSQTECREIVMQVLPRLALVGTQGLHYDKAVAGETSCELSATHVAIVSRMATTFTRGEPRIERRLLRSRWPGRGPGVPQKCTARGLFVRARPPAWRPDRTASGSGACRTRHA